LEVKQSSVKMVTLHFSVFLVCEMLRIIVFDVVFVRHLGNHPMIHVETACMFQKLHSDVRCVIQVLYYFLFYHLCV